MPPATGTAALNVARLGAAAAGAGAAAAGAGAGAGAAMIGGAAAALTPAGAAVVAPPAMVVPEAMPLTALAATGVPSAAGRTKNSTTVDPLTTLTIPTRSGVAPTAAATSILKLFWKANMASSHESHRSVPVASMSRVSDAWTAPTGGHFIAILSFKNTAAYSTVLLGQPAIEMVPEHSASKTTHDLS